jgi:hypothetical protein
MQRARLNPGKRLLSEIQTVKIRHLLAIALLAVSAPTLAVTIEDFDLGTLGVPGAAVIGNAFGAVGDYQDNFLFTINEAASAGGLVLELDPWWNKLNINVTGISLSGVGSFAGPSPLGIYDFGILSSGSYTLSIFSTVWSTGGFTRDPAGYAGLLGLKDAPRQVPEPGTLALLGLGLIGVALATRRRSLHT